MVQHIFEVTVTRPDTPRPKTHSIPAHSAEDAKSRMRAVYIKESVAYSKMTARKVW